MNKTVLVETIIWENPNLAADRKTGRFSLQLERVTPPKSRRVTGVSPEAYKAYRRGLDSACADIVICTRLEDNIPAVLAIQRSRNKPFGGYWWPQGGAIQAYRSIFNFLTERAKKECGVKPTIEAIIGLYRTCASDGIASTTQACYVATVEREIIKQARIDQDHLSWRLFTLKDLKKLPNKEKHWYPMRVFRLALETML